MALLGKTGGLDSVRYIIPVSYTHLINTGQMFAITARRKRRQFFKGFNKQARATQRYYGKTPMQIINDIRINFAKKQLEITNYSVTDIAYESG